MSHAEEVVVALLGGANSKTTLARKTRLTDLYQLFLDISQDEYISNLDKRLSVLASNHKVDVETINNDVDFLVKKKALERRKARSFFNQNLIHYACKLSPLTVKCPSCGSRFKHPDDDVMHALYNKK